MSDKIVFYQRLLDLSKQYGKSINSIERDLSYPRNSLHNYRFGAVPPSDRLIEVAHYFNVDPEYLLYESYNTMSDYEKIEVLFKKLNLVQKRYVTQKCVEWLTDALYSKESENKSNEYLEIKKNERKNYSRRR